MRIELVESGSASAEQGMADVLFDCVSGGASVGFMAGFSRDDALAWWRGALADQHSRILVARDDTGRIVGTVRLVLATMPNGRHRAEVTKLLVHRDARQQGVADALLTAVEEEARRCGRRLLILDTVTGSVAEGLYARRGWQVVGTIGDYAAMPDGEMISTTVFAKHL